MNLRIYTIFAIPLLLLVGSVSAQANESLPSIKARVLALDQNVTGDFYFFDGSNYFAPRFSHHRPSKTPFSVAVPVDGQLPVYVQERTAEGEVVYQLALRIPLPPESEQVLILAAKSGGRVSMVALEDNLSQNDRDWLLINTTATPLAFQMGDGSRPIALPPRESVPFQIEVTPGQGAAVRIAAYREEGWDRFYSTFWPVYEGQRGVVIFMQHEDTIRIRNFFEAVD